MNPKLALLSNGRKLSYAEDGAPDAAEAVPTTPTHELTDRELAILGVKHAGE